MIGGPDLDPEAFIELFVVKRISFVIKEIEELDGGIIRSVPEREENSPAVQTGVPKGRSKKRAGYQQKGSRLPMAIVKDRLEKALKL